ncbi:MAG: energy-coupling factor transporter transmembrane component T [Gallintestinimicrobium sp.]
MFLAAFRRADELACAMEARGYRGPGRRTKKKIIAKPQRECGDCRECDFLIMQVFLQK